MCASSPENMCQGDDRIILPILLHAGVPRKIFMQSQRSWKRTETHNTHEYYLQHARCEARQTETKHCLARKTYGLTIHGTREGPGYHFREGNDAALATVAVVSNFCSGVDSSSRFRCPACPRGAMWDHQARTRCAIRDNKQVQQKHTCTEVTCVKLYP